MSLSTTAEEFGALWPVAGEELARQICSHIDVPDWMTGSETLVTMGELMINKADLMVVEESFRPLDKIGALGVAVFILCFH